MNSPEIPPDLVSPDAPAEPPRHGFQGHRGREGPSAEFPARLTIAISRESGARGGTIARRVGKVLGWQVYNQDLLDYIAQETNFRDNLFSDLPPGAVDWAEERVQQLLQENQFGQDSSITNLVKTILAIAGQGEVVVLGRGAGCVLPRESTLNVRIVAYLSDRVAYMSQWSRLTLEEANEQVRLRDESRAHFIRSQFNREASDIYQYDLVLNSSRLGEDMCVELIAQAAKGREPAVNDPGPIDAWGLEEHL